MPMGGIGGWRSQDALHHGEHSSLPMGSSPSSNSHPPMSASNPGSPFENVSTISTSSSSLCMPGDSILARIKHNASLRHDVQESSIGGRMVSQNSSAMQAEVPNMNSKYMHSSRAASTALSSQASQGAGSNKISKRRSRAGNRNPITVLSADVSNFRAMVQQLTGIPSIPYTQSFGNSALFKPHPSKLQYTNTDYMLPTLDTSASLLGPKPAMKDPLEGFSFAQGNHPPFSGTLPGVGKSGLQGGNVENMHRSNTLFNSKQSMFGGQPNVSSSMWNYAEPRGISAPSIESQCFATKQTPYTSEDLLPMKSQYSAEDPWLFFDGVLADQANNIEIARMA
ncbi:hypothetical protein L7F22_060521 [Adiantum nelumboides]|nr:hypothetical protein [Adiantum nelumboides]